MKPARVEGAAADDKAWYRPSTDKSPKMQTETTSYGFHYAAIRKPIKNAETHNYLRITEFVAPYYSLIPPNNNYKVASVIVPINDEETAFHFLAWGGPNVPDHRGMARLQPRRAGRGPGPQVARQAHAGERLPAGPRGDEGGPLHRRAGHPQPGHHHVGVHGPVVDRNTDMLGASDLAIVEFRRLMTDAAKKVAEGGKAIGTGSADPAGPHRLARGGLSQGGRLAHPGLRRAGPGRRVTDADPYAEKARPPDPGRRASS